jgi:hypothetical protein
MDLTRASQLVVRQRVEIAEFFGFETRNKYEIYDDHQKLIGFCAEQQKGIIGFLLRQLMGHWRSFEVHFFDENRKQVMYSVHPFRFFFQEFHVYDSAGRMIGWADQRFGILTKKFDVFNSRNELIFEMRSGFFSFWTFPLRDRLGRQRALIKKRWSGVLKEIFSDADNFAVFFEDSTLTQDERSLVLAMSVFTDLQYFEQKAGRNADFDFN